MNNHLETKKVNLFLTIGFKLVKGIENEKDLFVEANRILKDKIIW